MNILLLAFLITVVILGLALRNRYFELNDKPLETQISLREVFGAFLFFLGSHMVIAPALVILWGRFFSLSMENPIDRGWVMILSMFISSLGLFFYTFKLVNSNTRTLVWRGSWIFNREAFAFGIFSLLICYPLVITLGQGIKQILSSVFDIPEIDQTAVQSLKFALADPTMAMIMIVCIVAIVPVAEEMLFRGYLQTWLKGHLSSKRSIMITSAVFALFHYSFQQGWSNLELLLSLFMLSMFLGLIYEKKESLWAPIGLHMIFNFVNVMILLS